MKWISLIGVALLAGCATGPATPNTPSTASGPPPLPPVPKMAKARRVELMSLAAPAPRAAAFTAPLTVPDDAIHDVHVIGVPIAFAYWNGSAYDLPVGSNWFQIYVPNPQRAELVQLDWSPDLLSWTNVGFFRGYTNGIWLVDPTSEGQTMRFYRIGIPVIAQ